MRIVDQSDAELCHMIEALASDCRKDCIPLRRFVLGFWKLKTGGLALGKLLSSHACIRLETLDFSPGHLEDTATVLEQVCGWLTECKSAPHLDVLRISGHDEATMWKEPDDESFLEILSRGGEVVPNLKVLSLTNVLFKPSFPCLGDAIERGQFPLLHTLELGDLCIMEGTENMAMLMKGFENNPGASASLTTLNLSGKEKEQGCMLSLRRWGEMLSPTCAN